MLTQATDLLKRLIAMPSVSRSEDGTADIIYSYLADNGADPKRIHNNVWALSDGYDAARPTLLLNSHHDTVKPSPSYTFDPFSPQERDSRIYGLGSNDAGASVVSLISVFLKLRKADLPFNLLLAITAEEEVSGEKGTRALLPHLAGRGINIEVGIVGEPTGMQPAVAERGLVVLDCTAHGVAGHAARNEGVNALYIAVDDIDRLRSLRFPRESATLGPVKISVTQIEAGRQHNVVPDTCKFVVDVRTTDAYSNEETVELIADAINSDAVPRSTRIRASVIDTSHPLVAASIALGGVPFVSPTTSDMALMPFPTLKIGPGQSARSHTADEYVETGEIKSAIDTYTRIITSLKDIRQ